jgi:hypothetical protein
VVRPDDGVSSALCFLVACSDCCDVGHGQYRPSL